MMHKNVLFQALPDGDYYPSVLRAIQECQQRCLCSMFIVDHNLVDGIEDKVNNLLIELSSANWRGVDARLIVGGSRVNRNILNTALLARDRAKELDIKTKLAATSRDSESHVKLIIADNIVVLGSHNWSKSMSGDQIQDSVLIDDAAFAAQLAEYFENQWFNIPNEEYDVSI